MRRGRRPAVAPRAQRQQRRTSLGGALAVRHHAAIPAPPLCCAGAATRGQACEGPGMGEYTRVGCGNLLGNTPSPYNPIPFEPALSRFIFSLRFGALSPCGESLGQVAHV